MADKAALKAELVAALTAMLESARRAHEAALEGATHAEARPENDKDTRGLEQSYLARGQAGRVAELEAGLAQVTALTTRALSVVALGALVVVEDASGSPSHLFIAPHGGGTILAGLAGNVQVVTPPSPLGRALLGKRVDDEAEVRLPGRARTLTVTSVT